MLQAQELTAAALLLMSPVPVHREEAKHGLPGTFSGTQEVSEGRGACHILSHLERGFENKSPFVIHSELGRNTLSFLSRSLQETAR